MLFFKKRNIVIKINSTIKKLCGLLSIMASGLSFAATNGDIGLYKVQDFKETTGACADCGIIPQDLWYFKKEVILVPKDKKQIAQFSGINPQVDVKNFYEKNHGKADNSLPALIWTGSPDQIEGVLNKDATAIVLNNGQEVKFQIVPKIASNLSYYNNKSKDFFASKKIVARGMLNNGQFIARTIWLSDFNLDKTLMVEPLKGNSILDLVKEKTNDSQLTTKLLWSKSGKSIDLNNKPVIAFILNGAQGDDDEAHGGHFAVATGKFGQHGEWNNWLVNNFYGINSYSEKGIVASSIPMDAYQSDLNSGQSWYRPSYMLVAVLKDKKVPQVYQESINRVFNHFYRHDFEYNHALENCTGINMETLHTLGWHIPEMGAESNLKAIAALPFITAKDQSLTNGKKAFDYLHAEMSNLYPARGFESVGNDLLNRIVKNSNPKSEFEKELMENVEAIVYVKIPQFPSSRAMGLAPVGSLDEYMKRVPEDKKDWKIVPVGPREFPDDLKGTKESHWAPSDYAVLCYAILLAALLLIIIRKVYKIIKRK
jgi:hypothetical protein